MHIIPLPLTLRLFISSIQMADDSAQHIRSRAKMLLPVSAVLPTLAASPSPTMANSKWNPILQFEVDTTPYGPPQTANKPFTHIRPDENLLPPSRERSRT